MRANINTGAHPTNAVAPNADIHTTVGDLFSLELRVEEEREGEE